MGQYFRAMEAEGCGAEAFGTDNTIIDVGSTALIVSCSCSLLTDGELTGLNCCCCCRCCRLAFQDTPGSSPTIDDFFIDWVKSRSFVLFGRGFHRFPSLLSLSHASRYHAYRNHTVATAVVVPSHHDQCDLFTWGKAKDGIGIHDGWHSSKDPVEASDFVCRTYSKTSAGAISTSNTELMVSRDIV